MVHLKCQNYGYVKDHTGLEFALVTDVIAARAIRVLNAHGEFGAPQQVSWAGGTFSLGGSDIDGSAVDGTDLWMVPGLVDAHAHVSWHSFNEVDRAQESPAQRDAATTAVLGKMLRAGFTSVRDAGGFDPLSFDTQAFAPQAFDSNPAATTPLLPRTQASIEMIGREAADAAGGVLALADRALERGARWIKLIGTASVASPPGSGLEPHFTEVEQRAVVARAAEVGAGVMLHAWGGSAIDHAIDAGVMSIEHGIFLTAEQARRAASAGMTLVPTLLIYKHVQRMIAAGELPATFAKRVDEAVEAHPRAVRRARDAGLAIALGTDFSTPDQHGTNRAEFDELVRAGLTPAEALIAATRAGAQLLARVAANEGSGEYFGELSGGPAPSGLIAEGEVADAVLFNRDPLGVEQHRVDQHRVDRHRVDRHGADPRATRNFSERSAFSDPDSIAAVIIGGRYIDVSGAKMSL